MDMKQNTDTDDYNDQVTKMIYNNKDDSYAIDDKA